MRKKLKDLEVDIIGGGTPLTAAEKQALSDFFKKQKQKTGKTNNINQAKKKKVAV